MSFICEFEVVLCSSRPVLIFFIGFVFLLIKKIETFGFCDNRFRFVLIRIFWCVQKMNKILALDKKLATN